MNAEVPRPIEVIAPLEDAWKTMRHILFEPFDLKKWCVIGFCAWLANLMSSGGGGSGGDYSSDSETADGTGGDVFSGIDWSSPLVLALIGIAVLLVVIFIVIALWVSSRGKFMFIDCIVHNRGAVREPWDKFRQAGNRLFVFQLLVGLAWCVVIGVIVGIAILSGVAAATSGLFDQAGTVEAVTVIGIIFIIAVVVVLILAMVVFYHLVENFAVPMMYSRDISPVQALLASWDLLLENIIPMLLYFLMTMALGIMAAVLTLVACCFTCCIVLIPYVGTVILLPVFVLLRAYALHFLAQFDEKFDGFTHSAIVARQETTPLPPMI